MNLKRYIFFSAICLVGGLAVAHGSSFAFWAPQADPHFSNVVLLIQPTPTSSALTDLSNSNHTVNLNIGASLSTDISDALGGNRKVIKLNGTTDYLSVADSNDWNNGSGDFTLEVWVYFTSIDTSTRYGLIQQRQNGSNFTVFNINNLGNQGLDFYAIQSGIPLVDGGDTVDTTAAASSWHHIALVRSGNTFTLYLNGTSESSVVDTSAWPDISSPLYIGGNPLTGTYLNGYFGAIRITKGVARYTSDFTRPSISFPER